MAATSWNLKEKIDKSSLRFEVPSNVAPIREKVLGFIEELVYPYEQRLRKEGPSPAMDQELKSIQAECKKRGLWALGHPVEIGGQGMPFRDYIYVNEVQGRSEVGSVCLGTHSLQDSLMLYNHASKDIKAKYLNGIVQADIYPSFAMTEPDLLSSDPTGIQTEAKVDEKTGEWVINGRKWWTSWAEYAEFTNVMVRTEPPSTPAHQAFSIICVPTKTKGYNILRGTHVLGCDGSHSEVLYDNVRVPFSNIIGKRGQGFLIAQERLGPGRIFHCMRWIGQAQRAFDIMCERLVQRQVPRGRGGMSGGAMPLGELQLMRKHVYDSYCELVAHRFMTLAAAEKMDAGGYAKVELAAAKANGAQVLCRILDRAVQVWGAKGLTEDTPLSSMYRHARASRFYDGPDELHIDTVGRLVLQSYSRGQRWDFGRAGPTEGTKYPEDYMAVHKMTTPETPKNSKL
mmetsp:Transcript_44703/g.96108  ORF Transcript_44703/g.96108 Transcript_44703/m.96108 type:complete len:456 (-) Transcript_44703:549-1916(-)